MKLCLVLNRISHSFSLLTREISWSTLEINFILPHIHVLFAIYLFIIIRVTDGKPELKIRLDVVICSFLRNMMQNMTLRILNFEKRLTE